MLVMQAVVAVWAGGGVWWGGVWECPWLCVEVVVAVEAKVVVVAGLWWLQLKLVVVVDRMKHRDVHLSELEILLNLDSGFEFIPVSSTNCLESQKYLHTLL